LKDPHKSQGITAYVAKGTACGRGPRAPSGRISKNPKQICLRAFQQQKQNQK